MKDNASKLHHADFIIHSQLPEADSDNEHADDTPTPRGPHFTAASFEPTKGRKPFILWCPSYIHPYTTVKSLSRQEIIAIAIAQQHMSNTGKELTAFNYDELTIHIFDSKGILAYSMRWDPGRER